jgi:hypothetical protein
MAASKAEARADDPRHEARPGKLQTPTLGEMFREEAGRGLEGAQEPTQARLQVPLPTASNCQA